MHKRFQTDKTNCKSEILDISNKIRELQSIKVNPTKQKWEKQQPVIERLSFGELNEKKGQ